MGTSCDATTCCEYNCKTSFVGTCIGDTEVIDKSPAIKDGKITFTGADPKQMPAADYWKWNGDEKKDLGVSASDSCCQKTCKSSGRTCTAKDGKEMMLKDGGKEGAMIGIQTSAPKRTSTATAACQKLANWISAPRTVISTMIAERTAHVLRRATLVANHPVMTWTSALSVP